MNREDRDELKEMLRLVVKPIDDLLQEHHRTLFGDGSESNQGLRVDVDRVKQDRRRGDKHFWVIYPTIAALFLKGLWEWVIGHGTKSAGG